MLKYVNAVFLMLSFALNLRNKYAAHDVRSAKYGCQEFGG